MCPAHQFPKASSSAVYRRVPDSCQDNTLKGLGFSPESRPQAGQDKPYCSCLTAEAMHHRELVALLRALRPAAMTLLRLFNEVITTFSKLRLALTAERLIESTKIEWSRYYKCLISSFISGRSGSSTRNSLKSYRLVKSVHSTRPRQRSVPAQLS